MTHLITIMWDGLERDNPSKLIGDFVVSERTYWKLVGTKFFSIDCQDYSYRKAMPLKKLEETINQHAEKTFGCNYWNIKL